MSADGLQAEQRARVLIDQQLTAAGWYVCDKVNLDTSWLCDDSLADLDNLPAPGIIAREIVEDLATALAEFEAVAIALEKAAE